VLARLPPLSRPAPLGIALLLSVLIHGLQGVMGYFLFAGLGVRPDLLDLVVLIPVGLTAMYLPTVAGIGARETAFVLLFKAVGIGEAQSTAVSLGMMFGQLVVAGVGGLLLLVGRPLLRGAT
jgi:uncharacterized membrane protein YbhN (UPF0104 family)